MKYIRLISLMIIGLTISSCLEDDYVPLKVFPKAAVNVEAINSEFDEFSETISGFLNTYISFQYSSDSTSLGEQADLRNCYLDFQHNTTEDKLTFSIKHKGYEYFIPAFDTINTLNNEYDVFINYSNDHASDIAFYTSTQSGNEDIYYSSGDFLGMSWSTPNALAKLNTTYNENGLRIYGKDLFFCSDADGNFDIYRVDLSAFVSLTQWLSSEEIPTKTNFEALNSTSNDKCPYISHSHIFFASNRTGGYGGYDIYYSEYKNGGWAEPVNCGADINSEYDELNPVLVGFLDYSNSLLFFSSNRTGGKGGYDIYAAGL